MRAISASLAMVLTAALASSRVAAQPGAQGISAEVDALTLRVERLEGERAVKKLQRAFGFYVDRGLWSDAADLFTDDGTIEIGIDGVYAGKDRVREYLKRLHGGREGLIYGQLNEWVTLQPAISWRRTGAVPLRAGATWGCWGNTSSTPNGATASMRMPM